MRRTRAIFALLLAGLLAGCEKPQLKTGQDYYEYYCAACHHERGTGKFLKGVPPLVYSDLSVSRMITLMRGHGRPAGEQTRMPVFSELSPAELRKIAVYLHTKLKKNAP